MSDTHAVHLTVGVRLKVLVNAPNHIEAIRKALEKADLEGISRLPLPMGTEYIEFENDWPQGAFVDELDAEGNFIEGKSVDYDVHGTEDSLEIREVKNAN